MITVDIPENTPAGRYTITPVVTTPAPIPNSPIKPLGPGDIVVDISRHNQVKDLFPKLKDAGVRGVILRATMGATGIDEKFLEYWQLAERERFDFISVYHLFIKSVDWKLQADHFQNTLGNRRINYPITVDFEPLTGEVITSAAQVTLNFRPLMFELASRFGYKPVCYTANWAIEKFKYQKEAWLAEFPLHMAQYTTASKPFIPEPWHSAGKTWTAWQFDNGGEAWSDRYDFMGLEDISLDKNRYSGLPLFVRE